MDNMQLYIQCLMRMVFSDIVLDTLQYSQSLLVVEFKTWIHVYSNDKLATYQSFNKCLAFFLFVNISICAYLWCTLVLSLATKVIVPMVLDL